MASETVPSPTGKSFSEMPAIGLFVSGPSPGPPAQICFSEVGLGGSCARIQQARSTPARPIHSSFSESLELTASCDSTFMNTASAPAKMDSTVTATSTMMTANPRGGWGEEIFITG